MHQGRELFVRLLFHLSFAEMTFCQADFPVILAALLLFVFFVLREEFAFLFQTFSRSDPPGKAPLTRGRYVFKKKRKEKGEKMVFKWFLNGFFNGRLFVPLIVGSLTST